jgi:molybdenum cofactor cytidylyltransferase
MGRSESICGVILAAGASTRMGRDKALLPWPPPSAASPLTAQTFLSAAIQSLSSLTDMVIVVAGANEPNLLPIVYANAAFLVRNPDPNRGQFSSLQVGLQEVMNRGRDAAFVTLVDRPSAQIATIVKLRNAFLAAPNNIWAVVPEYGGKHGHPVLFAREMINAIVRAPATAVARDLEHQHQSHIEYVPVADPFVTTNIDTPEDYAALQTEVPRASLL